MRSPQILALCSVTILADLPIRLDTGGSPIPLPYQNGISASPLSPRESETGFFATSNHHVNDPGSLKPVWKRQNKGVSVRRLATATRALSARAAVSISACSRAIMVIYAW
ncbi:hypothetical protein L210DRAFT_394712 [Boletus edulis BED1]|uniref:Secreted protein n=1 Tax=Boletus edulis BED1 TaxID=1328754 RepID=A0AAD4G5K3_BOLED|nr:hypothetical protein L210DRAFT_394712 [Boletus edulis BED1]